MRVPPRQTGPSTVAAAARRQTAFALFRDGTAIPDAMHQLKLARSTVTDYLTQYILAEKPADISVWVPDDVYQEVAAAAREVSCGVFMGYSSSSRVRASGSRRW